MPHRTLIIILSALSMMGALSIDAYLPALPAIAQSFQATAAATQQTLTVYVFAFAVMMLFYGTISDSFGRRPVILVSLIFYFFSSLAAAVAPSLGWLLLFRVLQGLSAGAGQVVGRAMVGDLLKGAEAQRALSFMSVLFGLAPALAPVVGGWLQAAYGWHSIFLFIAGFTLVLFVACWQLLPESLPKEERHAFEFSLIMRRYWQVGRHAPFVLQSLGSALIFAGIFLYVGGAPAFVFNILHLSATEFAWLFVPLVGGLSGGAFVSGWLSHRLTQRTLIRVGYLIVGIAAAVNLVYNSIFTAALPWAVIPLFFYGLGTSLVMPAMSVRTLEMFPKGRGLAASLQAFIFMIIFAIGSGLICPLLFDSAFHLAAGVMVGCTLSLGFWWLGCREI